MSPEFEMDVNGGLSHRGRMRAGIEIGGTFTDIVLVRDDGRSATHKVPSTPEDPSIGAVRGVTELLDREGLVLADLDELFHGSTIATNTLIERKGAASLLVTTAGFEDVLHIGRQDKTRVYDMFYRKPKPLISRHDIVGVRERLSGLGEVVMPLEAGEIDRVIDEIVARRDVESVAVVLLHAYRNPVHEEAIKRRWIERGISIPLSLSSETAPEFREYERSSTTTISAYVKPRVAAYLGRLSDSLGERGFRGRLWIMQSNGGVVPVDMARSNPARMFLSGPAAGVTGAAFVSRRLGRGNLLTIDIGGTSCDACILVEGQPQNTQHGFAEYKIDGLPISLSMVDIATLGAGGGSIAWVDEAGILQVGPRSAGAMPGPACYGRGGESFTVSDALLLLGMIDADRFVGGRMRLDRDASERAAQPLARRLCMDVLALSEAVRRIVVANIARALRLVTVQRGYDPREFSLFVYGGAGPSFAAAIAEEMGIRTVVVPTAPGVFSAFGLSVSDTRIDYVRAMPGTIAGDASVDAVSRAFAGMATQAEADLEGLSDGRPLELSHAIDARYLGQGYELKVPVDLQGLRCGRSLAGVIAGFHEAHLRRYAMKFPDQAVEIIACRTVAQHRRAVEPLAESDDRRDRGMHAERAIRFDGKAVATKVMRRDGLARSAEVAGPALVSEMSSATLVPPGWMLRVADGAELIMSRA
jgi:N-methylhydantoinase A